MYDVLFFIVNKYSNTPAQSKEINAKEDDPLRIVLFRIIYKYITARQLPGRLSHPEGLPGR